MRLMPLSCSVRSHAHCIRWLLLPLWQQPVPEPAAVHLEPAEAGNTDVTGKSSASATAKHSASREAPATGTVAKSSGVDLPPIDF